MSERPEVLVELGRELERAAPQAIGASRRWLVSGVPTAVAVAAAVGVAAIALLFTGHRPSPSATTPGSAQARLLRSFVALRRPRTPTDLLTGPAFAALDLGPGFVIEPELSRLILRRPTEMVWLVPGPSQLCIVIQADVRSVTEVGGACRPVAQAIRNGVSRRGMDGVIAVLPDGSRDIEAARSPGSSVSVSPNADGAIHTNFWVDYSFRAVDGKRHTQNPGVGESAFDTWSSPPIDRPARRTGQFKLRPPDGAAGPSGTARLYRSGGDFNTIWFDLFRMPVLASSDVYAAWLYSPTHGSKLLATIPSGQTRGGELTVYGPFPAHTARFHELLITTQRRNEPRKPGPTVLAGAFTLP